MASLILGAGTIASHSLKFSSSQSQFLGTPLPRSSSSVSVSGSLSTASSTSSLPFVYCGRGDKKTAKGKRFNHSFGNARPRDKKKGRGPPRMWAPPAPPRKDKFDDDGGRDIELDEALASG